MVSSNHMANYMISYVFIFIITNDLSFQDISDLEEKYRSQSKDLREAVSQRKFAMTDFTEINEKYVNNQ